MRKNNYTLIAALVAATLGVSTLSGCNTMESTANTQSVLVNQETVVKSQNDQRQYRYVELDNGLKVILVSDSSADKSAASMDVHIGHMADPKDREGLAHFLEHMLFLGTDKYPKVGEYNEYLKANGGWSNAGTGQEHTNYFFQVNQDSLEEATDRFAQFFISPSLDLQYVDREKNAVHSEYSMKIKDDARRIREVLKDTRNPGHPSSQFSVGNLDTLADRENDVLIDDLKALYKENYSASRMSLSLVGREDLDTLEKWAREKFTAIPNNGSKSTPVKVKPYLPEQLGVKINIEPMKDIRKLTLAFPVNKSTQYFEEKPLSIISSLLGQEGKGSLYSHLKNQGLIESLGTSAYGPDDFERFTVRITLTPKGLADYQQVTEAVFAYLQLLSNKQYNQQYFTEQAAISKNSFDFLEKQGAADTASNLSRQLQYFSPKNILNEGYLYSDYSHQLITEYLAQITPEKMRLVLIAKGLTTDQVQPEYNTPYAMTKINAEEMSRYQSPKTIDAFSLPAPNPFIATNLTMKKLESDASKPVVAFEKSGFTLWHKQDTEFRVPKASVNVQIYSDQAGKSALSRAQNYLYSALLKDSLNEFGYPAKEAELYYNVWSTSAGMGFGVNGYDEKQAMLLSTINKRVRHLDIDEAAFNLHKERLVRKWNNAKFDRPYSQARSALSQMQSTKSYSAKALASALSTVTTKQLAQYINDFHKAIEVEVLVHGNMLKAESVQLGKSLYALNMTNSIAKERANKVVKLNNTSHALVQELVVDHNDSTIVESYISNDDSFANRAKYGLFGSMINAPFFKSIRTDQQLGYIVSGRNTKLENLPGLSFLIQSPKAGPVELKRRIDQFMTDFRGTLNEMTAEKFNEYKQGLIKDLQAKDKNLNERTRYYWSEINEKMFDFNSKEIIVTEVEKLTHDDMKVFFSSIIETTQPIIVRSFGTAHQGDDDYKQALHDNSICRTEQCFTNELTKVVR
ncbi:insulinase family protein [Colwellia sp. Bg11-28]|uniref:insulinase family protein n=1 Tax=Colwellia sp. Bg11-28 TaxID=2058305 RepID=UPI000C32B834|nr:insulinase family protein [Colwellia sp. Bg11-28]PKH87960.1 peptidase M16 [Colwellia sp. Bg11-28]